jgi:predicted HicB family RNase H-like nuclease
MNRDSPDISKRRSDMNPHDYGITIRRIQEEDGVCFEARIRELPDIAEYADTFEDAYALAIDAIETTAEALSEQGRSMPGPISEDNEFSGRITLRLPRSLHRDLAQGARQEGVSLNQLLVAVLSQFGMMRTKQHT